MPRSSFVLDNPPIDRVVTGGAGLCFAEDVDAVAEPVTDPVVEPVAPRVPDADGRVVADEVPAVAVGAVADGCDADGAVLLIVLLGAARLALPAASELVPESVSSTVPPVTSAIAATTATVVAVALVGKARPAAR